MSTNSTAHGLMKTWPRININPTAKCKPSTSSITTSLNRQSRFSSSSVQTFFTPSHHDDFESRFINALVQAGSSRQSCNRRPPRRLLKPLAKRDTWVQSAFSYNRLPLLIQEDVEAIGLPLSKQRLLKLVDFYETYDMKDDRESLAHNDKSSEARAYHWKEIDSQRRELFARTSDETWPVLLELHLVIEDAVKLLHNAPSERRRIQVELPFERIFELYKTLPEPRILLLDSRVRSLLFELLVAKTKQTQNTMVQFLSLLDDMEKARIRIPLRVLNTAVHLVAWFFAHVSSDEVEQAIRKWALMENQVGVHSDITTFNILFDVAAKGGQYALCEMILDEVRERGLKLDLFTYTSMIYYYGLRGDSDGIRRSYQMLVDSSAIVDISALNAVMASLLRVGEVDAAHHVLLRMRDTAETNVRDANRHVDRRASRAIKRLLAKNDIMDRKLIEQLQQEQDISPDRKSFQIFVNHHVERTGDLTKIIYYLTEMQSLNLEPSGPIFLDIFRGFYNHGGIAFTLWNATLLEQVWEAFGKSVQSPEVPVYWGKWIAIWILRAYTRCCGREAAEDKWALIREEWDDAKKYDSMMFSIIDATVQSSIAAGRRPRLRWTSNKQLNI